MRKINYIFKVKIVKNKKAKSEYIKQNMAVVKKILNLLKEEELIEEVRKHPVLYDKIHQEYMEKDAGEQCLEWNCKGNWVFGKW